MALHVGITISPPTDLTSIKFRYQKYYDMIDPVLRQMCRSYILYPEFDKHARLHFHGTCRGFDIVKYFHTKYKLDRIGFTKVDKFRSFIDAFRYIMYAQKQWRSTCRVFDYSNINLTPLMKKNKRKKIIKTIDDTPKSRNIFDYFRTK